MPVLIFLEKIVFGTFSMFGRIGRLLLPIKRGALKVREWAPHVLWCLRFLLILAGLVGLWVIGRYLPTNWIVAPRREWQQFWLPILGLLAYLIVVTGLWLLQLLGPEAEEVEFADIKQAWEQGRRDLSQAGIDLTEAPLFLIVGKPVSGDNSLLEGAKLPLKVRQSPPEPAAPLHIFGGPDGIYVTCPGASLLGRQAEILSGEASALPGASTNGPVAPAGGDDIFKTLTPKGKLKDVQVILARAREQNRNPDQLTDEEKQEIRQLMTEENLEYEAAKPRPLLLKHTEEVKLLTARLRYLCRLIVRDRQPYCPLNGILIAIPFAATDSREDADQTGALLQLDLATIRRTAQVRCPVFALVCDLETAPGFDTFLERFPVDQRQRRVGQRYPLMPDLAEGQSPTESLDKSVQWIASALIPTHIYRLFRVESSGPAEAQTTVIGNVRLYQLLRQMRERQKLLSGLVVRGLATEQEPYLFGGCYLAATGTPTSGAQAFLPGVLRRLIENQSFVSWTEAGKQEEESYGRWTRYGYTGIAVAGLVLAVFVGVLWSRS